MYQEENSVSVPLKKPRSRSEGGTEEDLSDLARFSSQQKVCVRMKRCGGREDAISSFAGMLIREVPLQDALTTRLSTVRFESCMIAVAITCFAQLWLLSRRTTDSGNLEKKHWLYTN